MKKIITGTLIALSAGISGFAEVKTSPLQEKSWEIPEQDIKVVNFQDLTEQKLTETMKGYFPKLAIEFSEKTMIPINFYLKGDLVSLVGEKENLGYVEIKQTFYVRYVEGELILSSDLSKWKPFSEFVTGEASVAFSIRDGKPSVEFGSNTNRRNDQ